MRLTSREDSGDFRRISRSTAIAVVQIASLWIFLMVQYYKTPTDTLKAAANPSISNQQTAPRQTEEDAKEVHKKAASSSEALPLCTMHQVAQGSWRAVTLERAPYFPRKSKCYTREQLITTFPYYHWHPDSSDCRYNPAFEIPLFCQLARNKTVGFMGDSLTFEHFASLAGHLGVELGHHDRYEGLTSDGKKYSQRRGFDVPVCNNTVRIAFKRQRYLELVPEFLEAYSPDVMVLNRGAHHSPDKEFTNSALEMIDLMQKHQEQCRQQGRKCVALWRTTAPGHPRCETFTQPATSREEMERHLAYEPDKDPDKYPGKMNYYYWWDFDRINQKIVGLFRNATGMLDFDYLPAYDANLLRPDGHVSAKDCLHNCDPGTVDVYNSFMLHAMRRFYE